jgi:transposase
MMSDTPITERQQYWLDHIRAADASDGSIAGYERSESLRSERFSINQPAMAVNETETAAGTSEDAEVEQPDTPGNLTVPAHHRARFGRRPLPKALPRVDVVHDIDEDDSQCGECGTELTPVSGEVTEQLDIQPARVRVLRHVRKTYACKAHDSNVVTATMPAQPIPRSLASAGTLAYVAVTKSVDSLTL